MLLNILDSWVGFYGLLLALLGLMWIRHFRVNTRRQYNIPAASPDSDPDPPDEDIYCQYCGARLPDYYTPTCPTCGAPTYSA